MEKREGRVRGFRLPLADGVDFREHCRKNVRNFRHADRNIKSMLARSGGLKNAAIAYFDAEGCLLGLYADLPMKEYLRERGITERTVWTERSTGNNAVTMGFRHERELVTAGADHACPALQGLVICFVPLRFRHVEVGELYHLPEKLGGIAVLAREGYAAVEYRALKAVGAKP